MTIEIKNEKIQDLVKEVKNTKKNYDFWKETVEDAKRDGEELCIIKGYSLQLSHFKEKYNAYCEMLRLVSSELYAAVMKEVEAN